MLPDDIVGSDPERQLRYACEEVRRRLLAGEFLRAEEFLTLFPSLACSPDHAIELLCTEFEVRKDLGQRPDPEEWYSRFPQWCDQLGQLFRLKGLIDDSALEGPPTTPQGKTPTLSKPGCDGGELPARFAHYELLEHLGQGGMGVVCMARDLRLRRQVALKRIANGILATPHDTERFLREAQAAALLRHPNIVPIYECGQHEGQHYLTMAFIPGGSLTKQRKQLHEEPRLAVALVEKVARAMHHAHQKGIIHRDLKPSNILLDEQGEPLVSDFGLAKILDASGEMTLSGQLVGTPAYMSPEQAAGHGNQVSARSDVWSLGVILHELVTGERPFPGKGVRELTRQILTRDPPRLRRCRPTLDVHLETIVLKCLERNPAGRYSSAEALADDLACWLRDEPIAARRTAWATRAWWGFQRHPVLTAAVVVFGLIPVLVAGLRPSPDPNAPFMVHERTLAKRQPATLIGETGQPLASRWTFNEGLVIQSPARDGTFTIEAHSFSLLQLLPKAPARYRFAAEVRNHSASGWGEVGIFFADNTRSTDVGTERWFVTFTFNDFFAPSIKGQQEPLRTWVVIHLRQQADPANIKNHDFHHEVFERERKTTPSVNAWHRLVVEVKPESMEAWWDDKPFFRADLALLADRFTAQRPVLRLNNECPEYQSTGALGLIAGQAEGSIRNMIVEPLP